MVELQILSKIMKDKSMALLTNNGITDDYFITYQDEYAFIKGHYLRYRNVPDKETFSAKFPDFAFVEVTESEQYLIETFNEEHLYSMTVPVITQIANLVQTDSNAAVEYLRSKLPELTAQNCTIGLDIISQASIRLQEYEERQKNKEKFSIPTGFPELDEITGGWQRGEELVVIFARTGQGKSWLLIKTLEHAWKTGMRVGLIEPEMSPSKTGYRFDTLHGNLSNTSLIRGYDLPDYKSYISDLMVKNNQFFVATPRDFRRKVTVSKLRSFIEANKLDILGIDGVSYLSDERKQRGDNKTTGLTNIAEDLMDLSIDLGVPILIVGQSNREGAKDDEAPDLENIRDSDGIAHNASLVIAAMQKGPGVEMTIRKNRNGVMGGSLTYMWDIDKGIFKYVPNSEEENESPERVAEVSQGFKDGTEVF